LQLLLVRHGPTRWNELGLIQGRTDIPLSPAGRAAVASWRLPAPFTRTTTCLTSPLARARETAALLGFARAQPEPRLIEMAWGRFEGRTLAALRAGLGATLAAAEARGLDFTPPGGEAPRMVAARLADLVAELARRGEDSVLVTHKGVVRAALALATGWSMLGRPPVKLRPAEALLVDVAPTGGEARLAAPRPVPLTPG
jgi:probable phosphoglycerate mutase